MEKVNDGGSDLRNSVNASSRWLWKASLIKIKCNSGCHQCCWCYVELGQCCLSLPKWHEKIVDPLLHGVPLARTYVCFNFSQGHITAVHWWQHQVLASTWSLSAAQVLTLHFQCWNHPNPPSLDGRFLHRLTPHRVQDLFRQNLSKVFLVGIKTPVARRLPNRKFMEGDVSHTHCRSLRVSQPSRCRVWSQHGNRKSSKESLV